MPYLPPGLIEEANFPKSWARDVQFQIKAIEEQYRRMYPPAEYYMLKKAATPAATPSQIVGEAGTTKFDSLYGESVDSNLTAWQQPHGTAGAVKAANVDLFNNPIKIPRRFQRIAREEELKKYGFDLKRTAIVYIPTSLLDRYGITVQAGDKMKWNNEDFAVLQWAPTGWWKDSTVYLYLALNVEHLRAGA